MTIFFTPTFFPVAGLTWGTPLSGTPFGSLANMPSAFDGFINRNNSANNAANNNTADAYIGLAPAAASKVWVAEVYGSNNDGYFKSGHSLTFTLYGKNGTPASSTDGTALGSISFTDSTNENAPVYIYSSSPSSSWDHIWVNIHDNTTSNGLSMGQLVLYEAVPKSAAQYAYMDPYYSDQPDVRQQPGWRETFNNAAGASLAFPFRNAGKYYWEVKLNSHNVGKFGVATREMNVQSGTMGDSVLSWGYGGVSGQKIHSGSSTAYGAAVNTVGDVVGTALDIDNGAIWWSKNGVWQNSATIAEIGAGTTTHAAFTTGLAGLSLAPGGSDLGSGESFDYLWLFKPTEWNFSAPAGFGPWTDFTNTIFPVVDVEVSGASITAPNNIVAGDLIVLWDRAQSTDHTSPTEVIPSGFTKASQGSNYFDATGTGYVRAVMSYKKADGTEGGTSITGMNATSTNRKTLAVFRKYPIANTISQGTWVDQPMVSGADPSTSVLSPPASASPLVMVMCVCNDNAPGYTFSTVQDATLLNQTTVYANMLYKVYNSAAASNTLGANGVGGKSHLYYGATWFSMT